MNIEKLLYEVREEKTRSAWDKAKKIYAIELLEDLKERYGKNFDFIGSPSDKKDMLNGAENWNQYSYGGCSLIYNYEIAERVCSPSEYKKSKEGERNPNANENWLDVQTRCLYQAERMIKRLSR